MRRPKFNFDKTEERRLVEIQNELEKRSKNQASNATNSTIQIPLLAKWIKERLEEERE